MKRLLPKLCIALFSIVLASSCKVRDASTSGVAFASSDDCSDMHTVVCTTLDNCYEKITKDSHYKHLHTNAEVLAICAAHDSIQKELFSYLEKNVSCLDKVVQIDRAKIENKQSSVRPFFVCSPVSEAPRDTVLAKFGKTGLTVKFKNSPLDK